LHSHINHSCAPNLSVRHLDQRTALSRITVLAKQSIAPGEELTITYVDPSKGVRARRRDVAQWGFGECRCERCEREEKELKEAGKWEEGANGEDMERELKSGFGLM
jgi:SET domain-containing protein